MKRAIGVAVLAVATIAIALLLACGGSDEPTITYEMKWAKWASGECDSLGGGCASVSYEYPEFSGPEDDTVAAALNMRVKGWVLSLLSDSYRYADVERFADDFIADFMEVQAEFEDYSVGWQHDILVKVEFDSLGILSLAQDIFAFSGGAHPMTTKSFLNLRTETGEALIMDDLMVSEYREALNAVAEEAFRQSQELAPDADLEQAGYWFADNTFAVNDNFGIARDGIVCHFNAYEIAPYAMGPVTFTVPYERLEGIIDPNGPIGALIR